MVSDRELNKGPPSVLETPEWPGRSSPLDIKGHLGFQESQPGNKKRSTQDTDRPWGLRLTYRGSSRNYSDNSFDRSART